MIRLEHITKAFNKGKANEVIALNDVTLEIKNNQFAVIVGANGSGKSTLLNVIAGSVDPTAGRVYVGDKDVTKLADYERSQWIARVFQNPLSGTAPDLSILDNFRLAAIRTKAKGLGIGVSAAFKQVVKEKVSLLGMGLEDKLGQPMGALSGGQRQALTLLMSVMDNCQVLLLDEPTAALDPRSSQLVMQTADQLVKDYALTAILITHNLKDAYTYGNRIIQMAEGGVVEDISDEKKLSLTQNEIFEWFS